MLHTNRRTFLAATGAAVVNLHTLFAAPGGANGVDEVLRSGIARRKIPAVVGMIASDSKTLYGGAFGMRDASGPAVRHCSWWSRGTWNL
jgi:hypothetical protein